MANVEAILVVCLSVFSVSLAWGSNRNDRVNLRDVEVITLHQGAMTNGRRSSPVHQLMCVGGTAGCRVSQPKVVQCYNRGWDGVDVQWECKAEMDKDFKFGRIEVSCEGYDAPDDPYILKGSCGLEYEIDYGQTGSYNSNGRRSYHGNQEGSTLGTLIGIVLFILIMYACFKVCQGAAGRSHSYTAPPTYGSGNIQGSTGTGGPGFWSGAGMGGLLGYMFGRNRGGGGYHGYHTGRRGYGSGWNWGGGNSSNWGSSSRGYSSSSSTHTSSGFGGTKRR